MKTTIYYVFLVMISFSLMSTTCDTDDMIITDNSMIINEVINIAETDSWRITSYIDSGQDETTDFTNYDFTFQSDGTLIATNSTDQVAGIWSVTDSNSNDDSSSDDDIDFNINFNVATTSVFFDLNDDWDIVSYTSTTISLQDVSGGNGGTDTLVFQKN
ncbi:hypothetical protein [Kordia aestuariivivens]|uniref:hypothetical protein n=1 Tax=Kordia aestuariivivens TaxID=2759037 RepID=UPI001F2D4FBB|nr:hypothetical protein [Kordia aestuariivivens]